MFRTADLVLLSKSDLLPILDDFKPENANRHLHDIASTAPVIELSAKNKAGMPLWLDWIEQQLAAPNSAEHPCHQNIITTNIIAHASIA